MKFSFDRDAMIKEVSIAQEVITTKLPDFILSNILLNAENNTLTIKATNTSANFITTLPVDIQEEGIATIHCDKFMNILSSLPAGEVEFAQDPDDIKVTIRPVSKKIKFQLKSIGSEKFPDIAVSQTVPFFEVPSKELKEMIQQTVFAVSSDPARAFLTGVYFTKDQDNLIMVATDGRRLSYASKPIAQNILDFTPAVVPVKILNCILKNASDEGSVMLAVVDRMIFFKFANYEFSSSLLEVEFPNYKRVIPENQSFSFQVLKSDIDQALRRTALMVDKKSCRILFKIQSGVLQLVSPESEFGTADEEIPCRYDGNPVTIAINYHYIEDPLKVMNVENIVFEFTEPSKAVTLHAEPKGDYFHIIMPMNVE